MNDTPHLLRSKRFMPLFITQFFGAFNDNAFKNAFLIWFTYDVAQAQNLDPRIMVTLAAGLFILPFFMLSATAGQVADKYEKSRLILYIKLCEVVLMVTAVTCFYLEYIIGLLVVLFMMGAQSTFFSPAKYSLLPEHLREDELIAGNGLIEGGTFLAILLGTVVGGLVIRTTYGVEILAVCLIGFSLIGLFSSRAIPQAKTGDPALRISRNIIRESWRVIGHARTDSSVWYSILGISWFWLIGALFLTQFPSYTSRIIHGNEHVVTLFLTIFSVGIGVGSLLCNRLLNGEINGRLVPHGAFGMSIAIGIFYASSHWYHVQYSSAVGMSALLGLVEFCAIGLSSWCIIVSLLLLSVSAGIYIVPLYAIMQHRADEQYLARVIAANNIMNALFMVLANLAALALFAAGLSVTALLGLTGALNIGVFIVIRRVVKGRLSHA